MSKEIENVLSQFLREIPGKCTKAPDFMHMSQAYLAGIIKARELKAFLVGRRRCSGDGAVYSEFEDYESSDEYLGDKHE